MSTINYTYNVIVDRFRQFAAGHFQLRRFTHGEISQADLEKEAEWPWLHIKPRAINYSPGTRSFSFEVFISDLPRDKEDKTGYQAESITDCSLIFQDLINEIYLGNMFGSDVLLTRPVNAEPFVEQYTHTLTGVTGTIELSLDYDWSACSIPASWNYNTPTDSGSDGWGALQFIDSLDQNGAYVSLLNDVEAPGNSYYYGTNASGVKGWHQLIDNVGITCEDLPECATIISIVDDIAALQTDKVDKIAGKGLSTEDYTTAEKSKLAGIEAGAEVNVNADWNAISGDAQILNKPTIPSIAGLVPDTRTITINGTTQDLSADRTFSVGTFNLPSLTSGSVLFSNGTTIAQDNANLFWDDTNNRLGIGTASPGVTLDVNGSIRAISGTVFSSTTQTQAIQTNSSNLVIRGSGGTAYATLFQTTGNLVLQSGGTFTDAGYRLDVVGSDARFNSVKVGRGGGNLVTNTALGESALNSNTTGSENTAISRNAMVSNTTGAQNTAVGVRALQDNVDGNLNTAIGYQSGRYAADGTTVITNTNNSVFLGYGAKANANSQTNQIVIGFNATGIGSNSVVLGNDSITKTALKGNILIGTTTDAGYKLDVNGTVRVSGTTTITPATLTGSTATSALDISQTWNTTGTPIALKVNITDTASASLSDLISLQLGGSVRFRVVKNGYFVHSGAGEINGDLMVGFSTNKLASARLQVDSTTTGFLPPRMTTTQKNAIASPAAGLVVYDTTLGKLCVRTASSWETITSV